MKILVINAGSSSIKYKLFNMDNNQLVASGVLERIGQKDGQLSQKCYADGKMKSKKELEVEAKDHSDGMMLIADLLTDKDGGPIESKDDITAVGHRVVHGGEHFKEPTEINDDVLLAIKDHVPLAPLHNPANLTGIEVAQKVFASARQVAVFDTAFHQTIPPHAYMYALPYDYYEKHRVRRYGFHGTSHNFVSQEAAAFLGKKREDLNIITIHLGNGSSIAAVKKGLCIDTTMGMTPLAGLIMGTRCGDLDPAIAFYLERETGIPFKELDVVLNKESGFKGLTGENDLRQVEDMREKGDVKATLALGMLGYQIKKYIGSYTAAMGGVDALVFTAGIGENSSLVRMLATAGLDSMGIAIDLEKNDQRTGEITDLTKDGAAVKTLIVPTDEELQIARETEVVVSHRS
jgi:acetate kinase